MELIQSENKKLFLTFESRDRNTARTTVREHVYRLSKKINEWINSPDSGIENSQNISVTPAPQNSPFLIDLTSLNADFLEFSYADLSHVKLSATQLSRMTNLSTITGITKELITEAKALKVRQEFKISTIFIFLKSTKNFTIFC